jgi:hypothetical protein
MIYDYDCIAYGVSGDTTGSSLLGFGRAQVVQCIPLGTSLRASVLYFAVATMHNGDSYLINPVIAVPTSLVPTHDHS